MKPSPNGLHLIARMAVSECEPLHISEFSSCRIARPRLDLGPSTDDRAAPRDFAAVPSIELNNLRQNAEKGPVLRRAFFYFNVTANIEGALILRFGLYLLKRLLRNSTTSLRAASVASAL
jgi:hypothetical protein